MELQIYWAIVWRRKWIIAITIILSTIIATTVTLLTTPTYIATTTVRIATFGSGIADLGRTDINYSQLLMSTHAAILENGSVRGDIQERLGLNSFPKVTAEAVPSTELMRIKGEATNPETARDIANVAAEILIEQSQELYSGAGQSTQEILKEQVDQIKMELDEARSEYDRLLTDSPDDAAGITAANQSIALKERTYTTLLEQYESVRVNEALRSNAVTIVESAHAPRNPANPRHEVNIVLGILAGLIGGIALAFVIDSLDATLHTTRQIEAITKFSAVGKIPKSPKLMKIIQAGNGYQSELEAFRRLRTNLLASDLDAGAHVLMVTSAERGAGKSTISANLAVSIAQSGRRVAVVDCDMRLPVQHELFEQSNKRGLTDVLAGKTELKESLQDSSFARLQLLTSGSLPPNPSELLGSPQMKELLDHLRGMFDIILLDTPALLSVSDAAVLVPLVDNILLVVARTRSRKDALYSVRQQLRNVNVESVTVVVNFAEKNNRYSY